MITADQFIETHRDTTRRAECLASLALAANLVLEGGALTDKQQRKAIALDVLDVIHLLSVELSAKTIELSDTAERDTRHERMKGGAA